MGLETAFPGSYARLLAFGEDFEAAAAYADELLARWREHLDAQAIAEANEDAADG